MSLQNYLTCLSTEHLMLLYSDLTEAGIAHDLKGEYKHIFVMRRGESSGKRKKIYSALAKAKRHQVDAMANAIVVLLPSKQVVYPIDKRIINVQIK